MGACAPRAPPFNHLSDSTHFLTLSEAWDLEETKMAAGKWRACVWSSNFILISPFVLNLITEA